jgi:hypothetical protein
MTARMMILRGLAVVSVLTFCFLGTGLRAAQGHGGDGGGDGYQECNSCGCHISHGGSCSVAHGDVCDGPDDTCEDWHPENDCWFVIVEG